jgi:hypothetical protein
MFTFVTSRKGGKGGKEKDTVVPVKGGARDGRET